MIDKAEVPTGPGLWFMDSSSAAAEMVTLCAASGYVVHFFPTGQGNVIGNPILPVIKLCANPRTVRIMAEHIDVDVSGLLRREINMDQAGDKLLEMHVRAPRTAADRGGSARPPRVRAHAALRERLMRPAAALEPRTGGAALFDLPRELKDFQERVRHVAQAEIAPHAAETDRTERIRGTASMSSSAKVSWG